MCVEFQNTVFSLMFMVPLHFEHLTFTSREKFPLDLRYEHVERRDCWFIQQLNKCFLNAYYVQGSRLGSGDHGDELGMEPASSLQSWQARWADQLNRDPQGTEADESIGDCGPGGSATKGFCSDSWEPLKGFLKMRSHLSYGTSGSFSPKAESRTGWSRTSLQEEEQA